MSEKTNDPQIRTTLVGRLILLFLGFVLWAGLITYRLVDLQVLEGPRFRQQAEAQQQGFVEVNAKRGDILDRRLEELAISVRSDSVFAQPAKVQDPLKTAEVLSPLLEMPATEIRQKLASGANFTFLKRRIPAETGRRIRSLKLPGIGTQEDATRVYPGGSLAGHVLGFVGTDNTGLAGLEHAYASDLSGRKGRIGLVLDARRHSYQRQESEGETAGNTLVLTLDRALQHIAETVLQQTVESTQAINGSAILMDPHTGEILAMANYPEFDPNRFAEFSPDELRNRAVLDLYEPGSTFKVISLSALLNEHLAQPDEVVDCSAGTARIAGKVYKEAKRSYGLLTVGEIMAKSSNIGTVKLALRIGNAGLYDYLKRFGFGDKTGVDLPGEESGLLRPTNQWSKISIGAISIGQEIGVTPLQLIRAVAVTANGGFLVRPYLVQRVLSPQGDIVREASPERRQVLDAATAEVVRRMLVGVVEEGTGRTAALRGYTSAGKTGTAQKIVDGVYSKSKYVASYAGFAPARNPRLMCLVVINEPAGQYYGGYVAGPAFKEIMERSLLHLGVPQDQVIPDPPSSRMARVPAKPLAPAATEIPPETPLAMTQIQEAVLAQLDLDGSIRADDGSADAVTPIVDNPLPDFTGKPLREVARKSAELKLRLKVTGSGVAVSQRPAPGQQITPEMVCEVFFAPPDKLPHETQKVALDHSAQPARQSGLRR